MARKNKNVYTISGRLSYGRRILSFFLISLAAFIVVYAFAVPYVVTEFDPESYNPIAGIFLATVPFFAGFMCGRRTDYLIVTTDKCIEVQKTVMGKVYKKEIIRYNQLEYVSVFRNNYTRYYECRLFYNDREYLELFEIKNEQKILSRVYNISAALSIPIHDLIVDEYWKEVKAPYVAPEDREISAYLSEGKRPWWQNAVAALCFTTSICFLYLFFVSLSRYDYEFQKGMDSYITMAFMLGGLGVTFSMVRDCLFDFKNGQYKLIYRMGPFQYGQWRVIRQYEYVSIYHRFHGLYEINLWYNKSKHFGLGDYGDKEAALKIGKRLAQKFNVDLLYTDQNRDQQWLSLDEIESS